jgi:hypothetical protein
MQYEENLRKLFYITFNKVGDLRLNVSKRLRQTFSEVYSPLGNLPSLRETYARVPLEHLLRDSVKQICISELSLLLEQCVMNTG